MPVFRYLALGDSYTIGESVPDRDRWPEQLSRALESDGLQTQVTIIARTGWTVDELWRGIQANPPEGTYDLVTLLIGVDINPAGDDYELIPAGYSSDMIQVAEKKAAPEFNINPQVGKMYGFTPEDLNYIQGVYQMDPKEALREMRELRKAYRKGGTEARDAIAKERAIVEAMGLPVGDYLKQKFNKQSGVNVNVQNIMPGEAAEKAGQKEGYEIGEQAAMMENKYSAVDSIREAKAILGQGIYSGYWGDMGKTIAKASLGAVGDRQKAARTEEFMSYIGNTVVPRLKEFGGNDSNEEMRYLQKIMGGDTSMEPEAIAKILDSAERKIQRGIERLQRQRGALEQGKMPDLGPGPSRNGAKQPAKPTQQGVRKYNPATGRIK